MHSYTNSTHRNMSKYATSTFTQNDDESQEFPNGNTAQVIYSL